MNVLVAYASRHGATRGIAERIGTTIGAMGPSVDVRPVNEVRTIEGYDAVVLGSAAYMFKWLGEATSFAKRFRRELSVRPLWVFTSGPIGTDQVDKDGNDVREAAVGQAVKDLVIGLGAREHHVFFGVYQTDRPKVGMAERFLALMPAAKDMFPEGDFRDWVEIDAWAGAIADALDGSAVGPDRARPATGTRPA